MNMVPENKKINGILNSELNNYNKLEGKYNSNSSLKLV